MNPLQFLFSLMSFIFLVSKGFKGDNNNDDTNNQSNVEESPNLNPIYIVDELAKHPSKSYSTRFLDNISMIIFHHSAEPSGTPYAYAHYHVYNKDWAGIGYHRVIQPDGTRYITNKLSTISYHDAGRNSFSVGICLTGNFNDTEVPYLQFEAAIEEYFNICQTVGRYLDFDFHRNNGNTDCPGHLFPYEELRNRIENNIV